MELAATQLADDVYPLHTGLFGDIRFLSWHGSLDLLPRPKMYPHGIPGVLNYRQSTVYWPYEKKKSQTS